MQWLTSSLQCHAEQDQEGKTHQFCNQQKGVRTLCLRKQSFCKKIVITQIVVITKKLVIAQIVVITKKLVITQIVTITKKLVIATNVAFLQNFVIEQH